MTKYQETAKAILAAVGGEKKYSTRNPLCDTITISFRQ